ncbi:MAG: hypothetical protein CL804_09680 [Citromicrobium sp.]|nr:hypothetical protein [Citromicrobium sp.]|tara:strand:+ start:1596 stop:2330 length:735 start_codon:yes stop_codon:yes gene_type:complete
MNVPPKIDRREPVIAESWTHSVTDDLDRSRRIAWIVAATFGVIALLLAIALVLLLPLKTVEPYTLLVDRQTGNVEALDPLAEGSVAADTALTRSFLMQYVTARESFVPDSFDQDYSKVTLMSGSQERQAYIARMSANNPSSPLSFMPPGGTIRVELRSISQLDAERSLVRFTTIRNDPSSAAQPPQYWVAIVRYGFSAAEMSERDRLLNPLGFQVLSYRRDPETLPEAMPPTAQSGPAPRGDGG